MLGGGQIFRLNQAKYFILNTNEIVTVSLKYRFWVRVLPKRERLYFTLTRLKQRHRIWHMFRDVFKNIEKVLTRQMGPKQ